MDLPESVLRAINLLSCAGFDAYVVGGAVRDALRGLTPHDFDICTSARPEEIKTVFDGFLTIDTGIKHGTVTVIIDSLGIEITTFRIESGYSDFRRPDSVTFVRSLEADLSRRDFTINAMAFNPKTGLCDPFGGREDLKNGIIRCVGDADTRFREDALRILRALRFEAETGFKVEDKSATSVKKQAGLLANIASERVREELCRILTAPYVGRVMESYPEVFGEIIPEIVPLIGFDQHNRHHLYDVWTHTIWATQFSQNSLIIRLAVFLHDIGKPQCFTQDKAGVGHFYGHPKAGAEIARRILGRLKFDNDTASVVTMLVLNHDEELGKTERTVRRKLALYGERAFRCLLAIKKADCIGQGTEPSYLKDLIEIEAVLNRVLTQKQCFLLKDLAVNGNDMLDMGLQGREIGAMLQTLFHMVVDYPALNQREILLKICRKQLDGI